MPADLLISVGSGATAVGLMKAVEWFFRWQTRKSQPEFVHKTSERLAAVEQQVANIENNTKELPELVGDMHRLLGFLEEHKPRIDRLEDRVTRLESFHQEDRRDWSKRR